MGNQCIDFCNNLNTTIKNFTGGGGDQTGNNKKKKGKKFIDFNIGIHTVKQDEFQLAQRQKEENEKKIDQIEKINPQDLEERIKREFQMMKEQLLEQNILSRKTKVKKVRVERAYNTTLLDNDHLLQSVLGFSSLRMLNEKQCEPQGYYPLKNSDELLWEDQSEYLTKYVLYDLLVSQDYGDYRYMAWTAKSAQKKAQMMEDVQEEDIPKKKTQDYMNVKSSVLKSQETTNIFNKVKKLDEMFIVEIYQITDMKNLKDFESEFYYRKNVQQRITNLNQDNIRKEFHNIAYNQQLFMLKYSDVFIRVFDSPIITLKEMIKIRSHQLSKKGKIKKYKEVEILGLMVHIMRAIREADSIGIQHGFITDENIYLDKDMNYKICDFGELRILRYKDLDKQKKLTCSYSYVKNYVHKVKPRHLMFLNDSVYDLVVEGLYAYYQDETDTIKQLHEPESTTTLIGSDDYEINSMMMSQNMYSLAIIAIQMLSLGKFEKQNISFDEVHYKTKASDQIEDKIERILSFLGMEKKGKTLTQQDKAQMLQRIAAVKRQSYDDLIEYIQQFKSGYKILVLYLTDMLKNESQDYRIIMEQLKDEDFTPPNEKLKYQRYLQNDPKKSQNELDAILEYESTSRQLEIQAFGIKDLFYKLRRRYYQVLGYIITRNFKTAAQSIQYTFQDLETLNSKKDSLKQYHYKVQDMRNLIFSERELLVMQLFRAISLMEIRSLSQSFTVLLKLESALVKANQDTLLYINSLNVKYYQGLVTYIKGEAEAALEIFNKIFELSNYDLKKRNEDAYYQFIYTYFLLQLDSDGYFIAFKYIEEYSEYQERLRYRYDHISKKLILINYHRGKAYYEVSQFVLSKHYFSKSQQLMKSFHGTGSDMDSLRLLNLGFMAYLNYITNDMEIMRTNIEQSISIMQESLSTFQCMDTVVVWFNFFGFLLKSNYADLDEMYEFIEVFELTLNKQRQKVDLFFRCFVFGRMYYYTGNLRKAQELFLNALTLHQYYIADELKIKQEQNTSTNQQKMQIEQRKDYLMAYQEMQKICNSTLPSPERDNLTVRILIELYDWLGFIYANNKDEQRAALCYKKYYEFTNNLFKFDATLVDEYSLRFAKIMFHQKRYQESLEEFNKLYLLLKRSEADDELIFEYQQIQSEIQRWIGNILLLLNRDSEAEDAFHESKLELMKLYEKTDLLEMELQRHSKNYTEYQTSETDRYHRMTSQTSDHGQILKNKIDLNQHKEQLELDKLHQAPILLLLIQNYMRIVWDCRAINLKKKAIKYLEECMEFLENDPYLNSIIFLDVLKSSIKVDMFFLYGYLYGQVGQHEETNIYYQRTFVIVKEIHAENKLEQMIILRMSVIYDQMSRVLSNQGFYKKAREYLTESLNLLKHLKKAVSQVSIAYKHANIGAIDLRMGKLSDARRHTEAALKLFEQEYGKISVPTLTVKVKLMEILLRSAKREEVQKLMLTLIRTYQLLPDKTLQLDGQIERMQGQFRHKYGDYKEGFDLYIQAFLKLLKDAEASLMIFSKIQKGQKDFANLIRISPKDRSSLEIGLKIVELYIDANQSVDAFKLVLELKQVSIGEQYRASRLANITIFKLQVYEDLHRTHEGIVMTLSCFNRLETNGFSVFSNRRKDLLDKLKSFRDINLLYEADTNRLLSNILNNWERKVKEPYLYLNYKKLIVNPYDNIMSKYDEYLRSQNQQDIEYHKEKLLDQILKEQKNCLHYLLDALIVYQESIGDYHDQFIEGLFNLAERQYLLNDYEEVDRYLPQIIGLLKNLDQGWPFNYWRAQLLQIKCRLKQNKLSRCVMEYLSIIFIQLDESDDELFTNLCKIVQQPDEENNITNLHGLLRQWGRMDRKQQDQFKAKLFKILIDQNVINKPKDDQPPGQMRILDECYFMIVKLKKQIKKRKENHTIIADGNEKINLANLEEFEYEVQVIDKIIKNLYKE